jgi:hypothetical protein
VQFLDRSFSLPAAFDRLLAQILTGKTLNDYDALFERLI